MFGVHPIQGVASYRGRNRSFAISREEGNIYEFGLNFFLQMMEKSFHAVLLLPIMYGTNPLKNVID